MPYVKIAYVDFAYNSSAPFVESATNMGRTVYTEASKKLGLALAEARREAGVLQEDLAERLGKDQSVVSNIERGHRSVGVLEFYAIARALQVEPVELFARITGSFPHQIEI